MNKHSYYKKESECKCNSESIYMSYRPDEEIVVVKVVNKTADDLGFNTGHEEATIEVPIEEFYSLLVKLGANEKTYKKHFGLDR